MTDRPGPAFGRNLAWRRRLARRRAAERRFRAYGVGAIILVALVLGALLASVVGSGLSAFRQTQIQLEVAFDAAVINPQASGSREAFLGADYRRLLREALMRQFPEAKERRQVRKLQSLLSAGAAVQMRDMVLDDPTVLGTRRTLWLIASDDIDQFNKGRIGAGADRTGRLGADEIAWFAELKAQGQVRAAFNWQFFTAADSREPELAGIAGATIGSILTLIVTFVVSFPLGVMTAVYLEAFAPKSRWIDLIEVNINNLAAVPSIVFGLLGLAILLGTFGLPRSAPVVGGLTLAMMTLPTIIIAGRASLRAVPPSLREAALGIGASEFQAVFHHVLPAAMPGMMTGAIIGMARALGETAPLLMIGMVAFIADLPHGFGEPATGLPVQIYLWADSAERGFVEKTAAAIMVLLGFLVIMNGTAVYLRKRFELKW